MAHNSGGAKEWKCPECNFVVSRSNEFGLRAGIKSHKETHEQTKRWQCEFCSKQFRFRDGWLGHMNTHQGLFPFECVPCNKVFFVFSQEPYHRLSFSTIIIDT